MKASKIEISNSVIRALERGGCSPNRKFDTDPAAYAEYTGELVEDIHSEGFTAAAIQAGMTILRKNWKYQRWPTTAEIIDFLHRGAAITEPAGKIGKTDEKPDPERWARQQMRSQTGQKALAQGWHYELWMWATRNPGKTPQDDDIEQMRHAEGVGRQCIGKVRGNHENMFCGAQLLRIANRLDERKAELIAEFRA